VNTAPAIRIAIISDIHYASDAEKARRGTRYDPIRNPLRRALIKSYHRFIWDGDPFDRNRFLDQFLARPDEPDLVVANGDYACDSLYLGVSDDGSFQSAAECLGTLRARFGARLRTVIGDHELGKKMLGSDAGGLRLASYQRACGELGLAPFWQERAGRLVLVSVCSPLLALPVYESEALEGERKAWRDLRARHLEDIRAAFDSLQSGDRVLLFCHDPTALPPLGRVEAVARRIGQIDRTIIGHLHSPLLLAQARLLAGMPSLPFLGHSLRRMSRALREARHWKPFKVQLCPALSGIKLLKDGGYLTAHADPAGRQSTRFEFHRLPWDAAPLKQ
jgi:3',5'-cyclic AMP phosphodiesterase CpdA